MNADTVDRCVIVTGTTSGVGHALAHALLERRWHVLGLGRRPSEIVHERYEHVQLDLHDIGALYERLEPLLTALLRERPCARVGLVNNAADPALLGPVSSLDARRLPGVLTANVAAPVWFMGALVRLAPPHASLRVVNVSSGAAVSAFPGLAAYSASKAALRMMGMVFAAELDSARDRDIRLLSYEPGAVDTPMQAFARSQPASVLPSRELFVRFASEGQLVPPEKPAGDIVAFLESDGGPRFTEGRLGQRG